MTIIGVPGKDEQDAMRSFVEEYGLGSMPQAIDEDGSLWAKYGVGYQPAWVFIDDSGEVRVHPGALAGEELDDAIDELLSS